jgi:hypothetical protein
MLETDRWPPNRAAETPGVCLEMVSHQRERPPVPTTDGRSANRNNYLHEHFAPRE